jgi:hypothetical protein
VVATAELKVDKVSNSSVDDLRVEGKASVTDDDGDVGGKGGDGTSESGESSSSELHGCWYLEKEFRKVES